MKARLLLVLALGACGDNLPDPTPPPPDCSAFAEPPSGWTLDGAREAYRRSALRQRLRYREAIEPGYVLRETALAADDEQVAAGAVCAQPLAEVGRILFEHDFALGVPFERVQNADGSLPATTSCLSCHWQRGAGGSSGLPDAAFFAGDGDSITSADARNAPSLAGGGVIEALATEMTRELASVREHAIARAHDAGRSITVDLIAKGVWFGQLTVDANGHVSTEAVRGIDPDLVVRPFGWKGTAATLVEEITSETTTHLGLAGELTAGQRVALATFITSLEIPVVRPHETPVDRTAPLGPTQPYLVEEWARGRTRFEDIGCAGCHVPQLPLADPHLTLRADAASRGITVALPESPFVFSDLKRHDLGDANASQHLQGGVARRLYLTRPLWGVGVSAPYLHDGTAMTLDAAIARHGGEAAEVRDAWLALPDTDRSAIRIFLASLRRSQRLIIP